MVVQSVWRSTQHIFLVNTADRFVVSLSQGLISSLPKWEFLDVCDDVIIASAAAPSTCPRIYAAKIPAIGEEKSIAWVLLDEGAGADKELEKEIGLLKWGIEAIKLPVKRVLIDTVSVHMLMYYCHGLFQGSNVDFEALWMFPSLKRTPPVILWPPDLLNHAFLYELLLFATSVISKCLLFYRNLYFLPQSSARTLVEKESTTVLVLFLLITKS